MKPSSAKAKGRKCQQLVRDMIYTAFPQLEEGDIRSTSMGASGEDLLLSPAARKLFPFSIECKNQEKVSIWSAFTQAQTNVVAGTYALLVIKRNRTDPLIVMRLSDFLEVLCRK